jgi:hypothetical protein
VSASSWSSDPLAGGFKSAWSSEPFSGGFKSSVPSPSEPGSVRANSFFLSPFGELPAAVGWGCRRRRCLQARLDLRSAHTPLLPSATARPRTAPLPALRLSPAHGLSGAQH